MLGMLDKASIWLNTLHLSDLTSHILQTSSSALRDLQEQVTILQENLDQHDAAIDSIHARAADNDKQLKDSVKIPHESMTCIFEIHYCFHDILLQTSLTFS